MVFKPATAVLASPIPQVSREMLFPLVPLLDQAEIIFMEMSFLPDQAGGSMEFTRLATFFLI